MTLAIIVVVVTVWVIISLPIALIMGRIPRQAERAEGRRRDGQISGVIGTITR